MVEQFLSKMGAGAAASMMAVAIAVSPGATPLPVGAEAVLQGRVALAVQPQRAMLLSIARAGERLVAVGEHGTVALSDNNGADWRNAKNVPVDATLTSVKFADAQNGWAVGHLGVVLNTSDGGESWSRQLDGIGIGKLAMSQADAKLFDRQTAKQLVDEGPDKPLLDLLIEDEKRITVVGAFNLALSSVDGGASWQLISHQLANPEHMHIYGVARAGNSVFAVGEQSLILKRTGERFIPLKSPYEGSLFGVAESTGNSVVVFGLRGHAFFSKDGGVNWQASKLPGTGASLNGSLQLSNGRLVIFDQAGGVFASGDGGARFVRVPFEWGAPLTGMVEAADGNLVATSVVGITKIPKTALEKSSVVNGSVGTMR